MKPRLPILISLFLALLALPVAGHADDIDIYTGNGGGGANTPNMMFVLDSSSNSDSSFSNCTYWDGTQPSLNGSTGGQVLGNEQCALANIVHSMPTQAVKDPTTGATNYIAYVNLGITTANGLLLPLTPIDDHLYTGPSKVGLVTIPAGTTNRQAFILAVQQGYTKNTSLTDQGQEMQETWAYYTGGNQGLNGLYANNVGSISNTTFTAASGVAATGCMHNYITFIGSSAPAAHAQYSDGAQPLDLLSAIANDVKNNVISSSLATKLSTTLPSSIDPENPMAMEWARYAYTVSPNHTSPGAQSIVTYTIDLEPSSPSGPNTSMQTYWANLAYQGGGKTYAATDYSTLVSSILKILNEVQAINSVFSSSSLPVSVNAQGTYLNQVFMGMFRPDAGAAPRWVGNLKQYQFIYDTTTNTLHLGDSLGNLALSSSGTGFISPNALSFWTCANLGSSSPYADPYLNTNMTSTQISLMNANKQTCSTDPTTGFWASDPSAATALAQGFDVPDGERVERGGAAQQIRNYNLTTSPGATRNIYTYCPSGSSCVANLTDPSNAFAASNVTSGLITSAMFGTNTVANISSMSRAGNLVTVTTTGLHGFNPGDTVTIANADIGTYNGTFGIYSVPSPTTFTYKLLSGFTPTSTTGSYVSVDNAQITFYNLSSLGIIGRTIAADGSVTATVQGVPTAATGFVANGSNTVTIQNATPSNYDGTYTLVSASSTAFTYNITETPPAVAGSTGTITAVVTGYTNASCKASSSVTANILPINLTTPSSSGVYRDPVNTPTTVTYTTNGLSGWNNKCGVTVSNVVDSHGNLVNAYNGNFTTVTISGNTFTISIPSPTPTSPATNITGLTMQAGAATMLPVTMTLTDIANANPPAATVTATTGAANTYATGDTVSIGNMPGTTNPPLEAPYLGNFTILPTPASPTFSYQINTQPPNPSAVTNTTMTATRTTGLTSTDVINLVNWVRGMDNEGDEASLCPGGTYGAIPGANYSNCPMTSATSTVPPVTVRPSVHGDVLHSRPTVLNYGSYTINITNTTDAQVSINNQTVTMRTAQASGADVTTISNSDVTPVVTFANGQSCPVTVASGGTSFTYLASGCGNPGAQTAHVGSKIVVYYGDNGGVFHAVNGEQIATQFGVAPGQELWGFIPQETFYLKLARLRSNSPQLDLPSTPPGISPTPRGKDYFIDGTTGLYQAIDANGNTLRAVLYLSMRRGGHVIYAVDVTDPTNPTVLWKIDSTGLTTPGGGFTAVPAYSELGQTWSQPKVARVHGYSSIDPKTGAVTPVVFFGGGYDKNEDNEPEIAADSQGRAIFAVDAVTGALVWEATTTGGATSCGGGTGTTCLVSGMNYAIPADLTLVDRNTDGYIDRIYAADVGGNIWRVDLEPGCNYSYSCSTDTPSYWNVTHFAALGCDSGACTSNPASPTQRKFFYPPEIIPKATGTNYDAVIAGSGDREHPTYSSGSTQSPNDLFLLEDTGTGDTATITTPLTMTGYLDNCTNQTACVLQNGTSTTSSWGQLIAAAQYSGYYITLAATEKVVNAPLAVAGIVYISTNTPPSPTSNSCTTSLGTAIGYQLSPYSGIATHIVFDGGGLPPSPVAGVVNVIVGGQVKAVPFLIGGGNPNCVGPDCKSALGGQKPNIAVPTTRTRNYWYVKGK